MTISDEKTNKSHQSLLSDQSAKIYRKPTWASRSSRLATFERKVLCGSKWPFISCYSLIQCFWLWSSKTLTKSSKKLNSNCRHTTRHTFFWRLTQIFNQWGLSVTQPPRKFITLLQSFQMGRGSRDDDTCISHGSQALGALEALEWNWSHFVGN